MLEAFVEARHVAVVQTIPDARVDGEPAGILREQVGSGLGVEEAASLVPPDESATDSLGEGVEVAGGDRPGGERVDLGEFGRQQEVWNGDDRFLSTSDDQGSDECRSMSWLAAAERPVRSRISGTERYFKECRIAGRRLAG